MNKPTKIVFFSPGTYNESSIRLSGPPIGLAYIASYLEKKLGFFEIAIEVELEFVLKHQPDIVGISTYTYAYQQAIEGAIAIKSHLPHTLIVCGGSHISALPYTLHASMDIGVIGEGEEAMYEIVRLFQEKKLHAKNLSNLPNIVYHNQQRQLINSSTLSLPQSLENMPLPKRSLMKAQWSHLPYSLEWEQVLCTSRGCPFRCSFCIHSKGDNLVRYHSLEYIIEDLQNIIRHYPEQKHIRIVDEIFAKNKSRLKALAKYIRQENIHQDISFGCMARASFFDEEHCKILKSMNVVAITFGFETGSDRLLKYYLKDQHSSVAKNQQVIDLCQKYGIQVGGYFMIGAPHEQRQDLAKTYWFIRNQMSNMPVVGILPMLANPGTQAWDEAEQQGVFSGSCVSWESFSYHSLEHRNYLCLNRHYGEKELHQYYQTHLKPIKYLSAAHMTLLPLYSQLYQQYLKKLIYPQISKYFKDHSNFLLVGQGNENGLQFMLETHHSLTYVHWKDIESIKALSHNHYDGILLIHTLEKMGVNSPQWIQLQSFLCPQFLVVKNSASWSHLLALLDQWCETTLECMDQRYYFSLSTLRQSLAQYSYQLLGVQRNHLSVHNDHLSQELEAVLKTTYGDTIINLANFPLLAHMAAFLPMNLTKLEQLKRLVNIGAFRENAHIFSYSLLYRQQKERAILHDCTGSVN